MASVVLKAPDLVGWNVDVFDEGDAEWYPADVLRSVPGRNAVLVQFDHGAVDQEEIDLDTVRVRRNFQLPPLPVARAPEPLSTLGSESDFDLSGDDDSFDRAAPRKEQLHAAPHAAIDMEREMQEQERWLDDFAEETVAAPAKAAPASRLALAGTIRAAAAGLSDQVVMDVQRTPASTTGQAVLEGEVLAGRALAAPQLRDGACDPFVKVMVADPSPGNVMFRCKREVHRTDVLRECVDPQWQHGSFELALDAPCTASGARAWSALQGDLLFEVYDWNAGSRNEFIGLLLVPLPSLLDATVPVHGGPQRLHAGWFPLRARDGATTVSRGELRVALRLTLPAGSPHEQSESTAPAQLLSLGDVDAKLAARGAAVARQQQLQTRPRTAAAAASTKPSRAPPVKPRARPASAASGVPAPHSAAARGVERGHAPGRRTTVRQRMEEAMLARENELLRERLRAARPHVNVHHASEGRGSLPRNAVKALEAGARGEAARKGMPEPAAATSRRKRQREIVADNKRLAERVRRAGPTKPPSAAAMAMPGSAHAEDAALPADPYTAASSRAAAREAARAAHVQSKIQELKRLLTECREEVRLLKAREARADAAVRRNKRIADELQRAARRQRDSALRGESVADGASVRSSGYGGGKAGRGGWKSDLMLMLEGDPTSALGGCGNSAPKTSDGRGAGGDADDADTVQLRKEVMDWETRVETVMARRKDMESQLAQHRAQHQRCSEQLQERRELARRAGAVEQRKLQALLGNAGSAMSEVGEQSGDDAAAEANAAALREKVAAVMSQLAVAEQQLQRARREGDSEVAALRTKLQRKEQRLAEAATAQRAAQQAFGAAQHCGDSAKLNAEIRGLRHQLVLCEREMRAGFRRELEQQPAPAHTGARVS